jgi:hypothetical protein
MTKFQTILLAIVAGSVAGLLFKFVPGASEVATGLAALCIWLLGYAKQHGDDARAIEAAKAPVVVDNVTKLSPPSSNTPVVALLALGTALLISSNCSWWQKNEPSFQCAGLATVENAPELVNIVLQCSAIAVSPAAAFPCVQAAAGAKWPREALACFYDAEQGRVQCPAFSKAKQKLAKGGGQ